MERVGDLNLSEFRAAKPHDALARFGCSGSPLGWSRDIQVRAAFETSKLSSNIWKRVTTAPVIVRMIANCVAVILSVALIRVWSAPTIAARLSLVRMSS